MSGAIVIVSIVIMLIIMALMGEKNKTFETWFLAGFMVVSMIWLIHEDVSANNHKSAVIDHFTSMGPIYCQDGGRGSTKYMRVSMQDGFKYNKELERFESNSTIIEYRKSELCYIKEDDK